MKRLSLLTLLMILVFSGLYSCSKQHKIEKNLYSKGGDWNITQYIYAYGSMNPSSNTYSTATYQDYGKFHFSKDGSGTMSINMDGETYTESFYYNNTEDKLTINFDGSSQTYKMDWERNTITIDYDQTTTDAEGYQNIDRENIVMSKIK